MSAPKSLPFFPAEEVKKRFSAAQRAHWPSQYRPSPAVAKFLRHSMTESSSAYAPTTLGQLIAAKQSLQSDTMKAAAMGSDDGSANSTLSQPTLSTPEMTAAAKAHSYSLVGAAPLAKELPLNQRLHLEAAFLDFMSGADEVWLSKRYDLSSASGGGGGGGGRQSSAAAGSPPRLPWAQMPVGRRKRMLKKVTARDRSSLPSFVEMSEFLNLPMPYDVDRSGGGGGRNRPPEMNGAAGGSSSSPLPSLDAQSQNDLLSAEDRLDAYLRSVPEELPCNVEIMDFRAKGNRLSRAAGTMGLQMGSDPSQGPRPVPVAPVRAMAAANGTYRHSMESVVKVYEREVARAERAAKNKKSLLQEGGGESEAAPPAPPLPTPPRFYNFTPFAAQQEYSLAPISKCSSLDDNVILPTFGQLRDLLNIDYVNSFGTANYLSTLTGDSLVLTHEFVMELAVYLARRWNEIAAQMATEHAAKNKSSNGSSAGAALCPKPGPILLPLGNGRLAFHLNETGVLPCTAYATSRHGDRALYPTAHGFTTLVDAAAGVGGGPRGNGAMPYPFPSPFFNTSTIPTPVVVADCPIVGGGGGSGRRRRGHDSAEGAEEGNSNSSSDSPYADLPPLPGEPGFNPSSSGLHTAAAEQQYGGSGTTTSGGGSNDGGGGGALSLHPSFYESRYPITTEVSVQDALAVYKPSIVVAEPHTSRDYSADMRGCASVREVLFIGPVDSPAMGSFSFPWLTFGVSPASDTYQMYNDMFQLQGQGAKGGGGGGGRMQMPMDPPYMAQGYDRLYLDRISALTIMPNDSADVPRQGRCLAFRRL